MANHNKSLVLLKLFSPSFLSLSLCLHFPLFALFISIMVLSESVIAIPGRISVAQQLTPAQQQETRATAERLLQEGLQLYKQRTAESLRKAIQKWVEALKLWQQLNDKAKQALTLTGIGLVYDALGEKQKAVEYYNQALPLERAVGDRRGEAITLNNLGGVYDSLGEKQKAVEYFNQALPLERAVGNRSGEAAILNNLGSVYNSLGEKQKAVEYYNQALPLFRAVGDRRGGATTLNNLGGVYNSLGEKQKAVEYYNQALPLFRAVGDRSGEATTLNNLGLVYNSLGKRQKALKKYNQALPLYRAVGDKSGEATTLNNLGGVSNSLGEKQKAVEYYNQALPLRRAVGDRSGEAATLNNLGLVYDSLGEKQKALEYYNQALPLRRAVGDKSGEATTLYNIAYLERNRGNLEQSLQQIEAAVKIIENLRTKVVNQQLRTSYFASVQDYYQFYIDLLMQLHKQQPSKGYDAIALHINERARARNLLELLAEANVDIHQGVDSKLVELERSLLQQLSAAEFQRVKLLQGQYTNKQLDNIKQRIESLNSQLDDVQAQIRVQSPEYATLTQGNKFDKLVLTLPQIQQQVLDDNTLLLEYSLGEERSFLWLVSKTSITTYELPKGADIENEAKTFEKELLDKKDSAVIPKVGMKLSQMILAPVASKLKQKRLLFVGDGALQTIPFAVLPIPQDTQPVRLSQNSKLKTQNSKFSTQGNVPIATSSPTPLLVQHEILTLPSASSIGVLRNKFIGRKPAPKTIAILADPVFSPDDRRLKNTPKPRHDESRGDDECRNLSRLENTEKEANSILSLVPSATQRFSALGFAASVNTAIQPNLSQYQVVHFATHGCISEKNPQLSKLVFSQFDEKGDYIDGNLNLNKIYNLRLPVELVTMSACKTGLGQNVQGEGLIGLTRGFMYAGAKRVLVTLWSVNDLTTATLMQNFYQKMLKQHQNPVAAIRAAQLEMWKSGKGPYYWGAFTLQGEWQ